MKRSKFSLSHYKLLTCDMGELVPIGVQEVLPGDTIQQATSVLLRVSPLLAPVMHPVHIRVHHWFVPLRLIWDDFEKFITGGPDGMDASQHPLKVFPTGVAAGSLGDYLGIPPSGGTSTTCSALPFRAYASIFNEWYRDQDLTTAVTLQTTSTANDASNQTLLKVAWEKDYFTSARPWAQKGPSITLPLGTTAPVVTTSQDVRGKTAADATNRNVSVANTTDSLILAGIAADSNFRFGDVTGLQADLTGATAVAINDVREAFALQRYAEARARYGSRYTEYLRYLGVRSSDARLQRPEYLGGGRQTIQFSEVLQTGVTTSGTPNIGVGELKGHGIGALRSNRYRRFFEEHGLIISLLSVKPKTMYVQGLNRMWNRRTREDYFQRELQHIGQQEVLNKEIYAKHTTPDGVFGYQDRYDEYRRQESTVAGDFRNTTMDFWHMARIFTADPVLNNSFVESNPTKRINAVQTNDVLWIMANHSIQARRMLSPIGNSFIY